MAKKAKVAKTAKTATKKKAKKATSDGRGPRVAWSKEDAKELKRHSKAKTPVAEISRAMGRTVGALRQQAFKTGLSLGHRR